MSFEEKINSQLINISLTPKRYTRNLNHIYADYIELVALLSNNNEISINDILVRFTSNNISVPKIEITDDEIGSTNSEIHDLEYLWIKSIFEICQERKVNLGEDTYPFLLTDSDIILKNDLSNKSIIYLFLLISSNLNYFPDLESTLTTDFERVSFECLKQFLPAHAILKQFGKNSDYQGNAQRKIRALAEDMSISVNDIEINKILGNQERGLDIIGWIPFEDKIPNIVTIIGQCACGKEWYKKQHETKRFESAYFNFYRLKPINAMFIPYSLYYSDSLFQSDELIDSLLFERGRIMEYINDTGFLQEIDSSIIVKKCIEFQEDIV